MIKNKKSKTLSLDPDVYQKLELVCSNLGVTPHSYIIQEIGKSVNRDLTVVLQQEMFIKQNTNANQFFHKVEEVISDH
jgi:hypothetical protein